MSDGPIQGLLLWIAVENIVECFGELYELRLKQKGEMIYIFFLNYFNPNKMKRCFDE